MSTALYYTDAYVRVAETVVTAVVPADRGSGSVALVTLDRTPFYPGGGGQPADRGRLVSPDGRSWAVRSAAKREGEIVHEIGPDAGTGDAGAAADRAAADRDGPGSASANVSGLPAAGDHVTAEIDWVRRHLLMRTHTALHALCGVVWRDHGAQVTGGNMEPGNGRMDFEFERMSGELVGEIEERVNAELLAGRPVRVRILPREEAFAIPDLIRTKINLLPPGIEKVRTVEIVGLDLQADGGTHVANTAEVGTIRVLGYESKGRINKRIRIALVDPVSQPT